MGPPGRPPQAFGSHSRTVRSRSISDSISRRLMKVVFNLGEEHYRGLKNVLLEALDKKAMETLTRTSPGSILFWWRANCCGCVQNPTRPSLVLCLSRAHDFTFGTIDFPPSGLHINARLFSNLSSWHQFDPYHPSCPPALTRTVFFFLPLAHNSLLQLLPSSAFSHVRTTTWTLVNPFVHFRSTHG